MNPPSLNAIYTDATVNTNANYDAPARLKLDVRGDARFTKGDNDKRFVRLGYNGTNGMMDFFSDEADDALLINFYSNRNVIIGDGAAANRLNLIVNGKMGIGTDNPQTTLHLLGIGNPSNTSRCPVGLRLEYQYSGGPVNGCSTSSTWDVKNSGNGTLDFSTPLLSTPVMVLTGKKFGKHIPTRYCNRNRLSKS